VGLKLGALRSLSRVKARVGKYHVDTLGSGGNGRGVGEVAFDELDPFGG
jgi:hypothetical protein